LAKLGEVGESWRSWRNLAKLAKIGEVGESWRSWRKFAKLGKVGESWREVGEDWRIWRKSSGEGQGLSLKTQGPVTKASPATYRSLLCRRQPPRALLAFPSWTTGRIFSGHAHYVEPNPVRRPPSHVGICHQFYVLAWPASNSRWTAKTGTQRPDQIADRWERIEAAKASAAKAKAREQNPPRRPKASHRFRAEGGERGSLVHVAILPGSIISRPRLAHSVWWRQVVLPGVCGLPHFRTRPKRPRRLQFFCDGCHNSWRVLRPGCSGSCRAPVSLPERLRGT
jgi:hypothetical protein